MNVPESIPRALRIALLQTFSRSNGIRHNDNNWSHGLHHRVLVLQSQNIGIHLYLAHRATYGAWTGGFGPALLETSLHAATNVCRELARDVDASEGRWFQALDAVIHTGLDQSGDTTVSIAYLLQLVEMVVGDESVERAHTSAALAKTWNSYLNPDRSTW